MTVTDSQGATYADTSIVNVLNSADMAAGFRGIWQRMKTALTDKDVEKAVSYFIGDSQDLYRDLFTALYDNLPQIVSDRQDIQLIYVQSGSAKFRIRKNQLYGGEVLTITHYIYFIRDENGVWKLLRF